MKWITSSNTISLLSFTVSLGGVFISYRQSKRQNEQASHAFLSSFLEKETIEINELLDEAKALLENNRQSNKSAWKNTGKLIKRSFKPFIKMENRKLKNHPAGYFITCQNTPRLS